MTRSVIIDSEAVMHGSPAPQTEVLEWSLEDSATQAMSAIEAEHRTRRWHLPSIHLDLYMTSTQRRVLTAVAGITALAYVAAGLTGHEMISSVWESLRSQPEAPAQTTGDVNTNVEASQPKPRDPEAARHATDAQMLVSELLQTGGDQKIFWGHVQVNNKENPASSVGVQNAVIVTRSDLGLGTPQGHDTSEPYAVVIFIQDGAVSEPVPIAYMAQENNFVFSDMKNNSKTVPQIDVESLDWADMMLSAPIQARYADNGAISLVLSDGTSVGLMTDPTRPENAG